MEKKTIYLVKYSVGEYDDQRELVHSAYESEEDAESAQLDVYINIMSALKQHREGKIEFNTNLGDKHVDGWYDFTIEKNAVWVEELNYYTKKQS
jgi:hypothetical protein